jgi:pSer/pThr/pTyr-binding forkhead associated (FHA) protein
MIQDLGSTNGVFLNRSPIDGAAPLRSGDQIELGETKIVFEVP